MPKHIDHEQRREQIAEALWRVVEQEGVAQVSVRRVAQEAGLAVGSLRHVFPTRADLLEFSTELMLRRATERIRQVTPHEDIEEYACEVLEHLVPLTPASRIEFAVNLALYAEAPSVSQIGVLRDRAQHALQEGCRLLARRLGVPDVRVELEARRLHALVDGLALHLSGSVDAAEAEWAREILAAEVHRLHAAAAE
ncbi:TetR/AcrR family transcriptional regulator [Pseudoclavibacter caeni]|jgi:AcrR family transcriptional regulator|uniref:TetR family transcriptional regulator n=1 Tax=Pseudoclavibacter caeni TaxID=908846 RepID=A0A7C8BQZ2_9MICO|nr:TetR family transcriptional regulator C-terminal domain-containing protein [Pseudoclavibacter caeni]KAB1631350.1 TetR family transcriptional regulator [Pseudoclavibacter caeni]NYJ96747.1 AcrR family transcriptional regulator [Pseudoclavibacter caeni]